MSRKRIAFAFIGLICLLGIGVIGFDFAEAPHLRRLAPDTGILWVKCDFGKNPHGYIWRDRPLGPLVGRLLTSVDKAGLRVVGKRLFNVRPYYGLASKGTLFIQVGIPKKETLRLPYACDFRVTFTDQKGLTMTNADCGIADNCIEEHEFHTRAESLNGCKLEFYKVDHGKPFELFPTNGLGQCVARLSF